MDFLDNIQDIAKAVEAVDKISKSESAKKVMSGIKSKIANKKEAADDSKEEKAEEKSVLGGLMNKFKF